MVIMDMSKYIQEIIRQLSDTSVYICLDNDPMCIIKGKIEFFLSQALADNIIDNKLKKYLSIEHPTVPVLYILPKVHKSLIDPPGWPIVSGRGSILSNIAKFIDQILRPHVLSMKSYIRDTGDFLEKLSKLTIPKGTLLVTFDVVSLYTSIIHKKGLNSIKCCLTLLYEKQRIYHTVGRDRPETELFSV